ncbi:polysaccharide biosynthesis protein [Parabacteroides merdae]|uniref:polysaccharide biosynthesis protein n=1 Tax=Parabacteroides merdae TaxID=46503 RepID=UPI0018985368|nr:nucleoside-diphosphate sugar epimerase/dehydratase [Parabacteroides merdae]MDB8902775.1 nucleoside-diphosphate sugar epimerase/dehydratase [Parabacteroides merdae]MDB8906089.1 nucleoside-diphosphate sugar epimerase/dehydratase [Parabacteroides merdae]
MKINDLLLRLTKEKYLNRWIIFLIDLFLSVFSTVTSLALVSYILDWNYTDQIILTVFLASLFCSTASFLVCQTYKGIIRHSAFTETGRIAMSSSLKVATILPVLLFTTGLLSFRGFLLGSVVDFFLTFFILTIFRAFLITLYTFMVSSIASNRKDKLFIFGHEDSSPALLNDSFLRENSSYQVEGFLRFGQRVSMRIGLYKVYFITDQEEFSRWVNRYNIKAILFTDYKAVKEESERLVRFCEKEKVRMLLLPSLDELKGGKLKMRALPEVRIEDLLGREEIRINMEEIAGSLKGKVVLVTGAAGSIGSELCRQLCHFGLKQLVLFDSAETPMHNIRLELEEKFPDVEFTPVMGDIRMIHRVESIYQRFHPQLVFHAAAYKHVPLMEENPCEAVHTNVYGTRNVADMAVKYDVDKFIMVSTDKAVNPTNVMGASKRLAEMYVQSLSIAISKGRQSGKTRFITTRFGNVLGSNGSVIPRFREQLAKGGPLTVTHPDIIRYFMTIPEACRLVLEAAFMGKGNEIFVFDMGTPVKIANLARRMIELAGLVPDQDIEIKYTGLRPGEKLYEELLATKENTLPTENEKIYRAQVREYDYEDICTLMSPLIDLAIKVDKMGTVRMMKGIVPEFKSKNSVYEALDKAE